MKYYLAIDIGASSGRHILGTHENGIITLAEIYRFENKIITKNETLCWDIDSLYQHIIAGLKICRDVGKIPITAAIDTWGVDFVLIDSQGSRVGDAVSYRDSRTQGMDAILEKRLPFDTLYAKAGTQKQRFNTIYQLKSLAMQSPNMLGKADRFLMIPEYFNYLLTGVAKNEYTNSTSTSLVNATTKTWDEELLSSIGVSNNIFGSLHMPGEAVGELCEKVQKEVGFSCSVVLPATHDTASAYISVPAKDENAIYISSGTWSLLGIETAQPILTEAVRIANFTNEGGYGYRFRFLKNIMGLWMIQSIRRNLDNTYTYAQLEKMARKYSGFPSIVDVNDDIFLSPESMIEAVKESCRNSNQAVPKEIGEVVQCVYKSLASCYANTIQELETITKKKFTSIHIVGGGSKDGYLNSLTAKASGLPVYAGPSEGTVIGNLIVQMIGEKEFKTLQEAKEAVQRSFSIQKYG